MIPSSSFVNPTSLAHADTPRDIHPRGREHHRFAINSVPKNPKDMLKKRRVSPSQSFNATEDTPCRRANASHSGVIQITQTKPEQPDEEATYKEKLDLQLHETPISSRTFKQKSVSLSTMEDEYVSLTEAAKGIHLAKECN
ncbi:hypothetical protein TNCV_4398331 [Trichonephila clavipes]|nr:hypothetical protein TNCV_4398331 [Trichonephila clavipes]